jgi:hypothetical protein
LYFAESLVLYPLVPEIGRGGAVRADLKMIGPVSDDEPAMRTEENLVGSADFMEEAKVSEAAHRRG